MIQGIKVDITEEEWSTAPIEVRNKIKFILLNEYGYDIGHFDEGNSEE